MCEQGLEKIPRHKKIDPFHLIITDRDRGVFNVVGPMTDDTDWNKKVCECQDKGRHVNCQTANRALTEQQIVEDVKMRLGLSYTDDSII